MNRFRVLPLRPSILLAGLLGSLVVAGCSAPQGESTSAPQSLEQTAGNVADIAQQDMAAEKAQNNTQSGSEAAPTARPQLVKTAAMALRVESVTTAIQQVSKVVNQNQGDILRLTDQGPPDSTVRQTASMELRVPQAQLDRTLEQLSQLGTVQSRSIRAEDVANQLVDYQARLRNLRKSEEVVLNIMERSGSIADVLKVSQELSNIRASIEQIDAQLKRLQTQVAFSTITLTLEAAIATTVPQRSLGDRLKEAFSQSTHAFSELTIGLLAFGVRVLVFSPYLIGLFLLGLLAKRQLFRRQPQKPLPSVETPASSPPEDADSEST